MVGSANLGIFGEEHYLIKENWEHAPLPARSCLTLSTSSYVQSTSARRALIPPGVRNRDMPRGRSLVIAERADCSLACKVTRRVHMPACEFGLRLVGVVHALLLDLLRGERHEVLPRLGLPGSLVPLVDSSRGTIFGHFLTRSDCIEEDSGILDDLEKGLQRGVPRRLARIRAPLQFHGHFGRGGWPLCGGCWIRMRYAVPPPLGRRLAGCQSCDMG